MPSSSLRVDLSYFLLPNSHVVGKRYNSLVRALFSYKTLLESEKILAYGSTLLVYSCDFLLIGLSLSLSKVILAEIVINNYILVHIF